MVPARPYWKGYLKLSLVSCPIALYTGTSSTERVSFRQINKQTGHRLRQQLVDEVTREPVEGADKGRGYEYAKNVYIPVDDDELDAIAIESTHTIEIDSFVPREQIDERYLDSPYYIMPHDRVGQEAFAVIREAMRGKDMAALGRVVLAKRERVIMLQSWDNGLMGTTLRYPYEIRDAKEYFDDIPNVSLEPDMLKLAEHILRSKATEFDPSRFVDHYEEAVVEMLKKKQAGMAVSREREAPRLENVVNLILAVDAVIDEIEVEICCQRTDGVDRVFSTSVGMDWLWAERPSESTLLILSRPSCSISSRDACATSANRWMCEPIVQQGTCLGDN